MATPKENEAFYIGIALGMVIIVLFTMGITAAGIGSIAEYKQVISECEAELPRNQHCVLTAVPEDSVSP